MRVWCIGLLCFLTACMGSPAETEKVQPSERPLRVDDCHWFEVLNPGDPESLSGEQTIYHQGPQVRPSLLHAEPLRLSQGLGISGDQVILVRTVLSDQGRIVRACLLRVPDPWPVTAGDPEDLLLPVLREFRFTSARLDGRPVPVFYNVTVPIQVG